MSFSPQSDVWSYGVTIWELFQLGETPWPGNKFGLDFVKELKHGKRLEKPIFATCAMYQIMLNCWNEAPEKRPSFKKLSQDFQQLNAHHFR
ncbi:Vascular endothelial growth factor receptor 2 [Orchesella cincta]|uniref:Vascular endothelial growth factor receptor 2 n=1 Tax=Orchesella cincta TaxID=48709 RepID=A0A1D2MND2_ORCCI|nr:Vascular endothelial growth factor receptor 2 [Orchesella cincta]